MLRVIVLAGGGSRRLGHDKLAVDLGGSTVLDRVLDGIAGALPRVPIVAVGPPRMTRVVVSWRTEQPPGGGPVAALASALDDDLDPSALVAVVAGDLPFMGSALPVLLAAATAGVDGALAVDGEGRDQPLLGAYRVGPLRAAIGPAPAGRAVRDVLRGLRLARVRVEHRAALDVDTAADLEAARAAVAEQDLRG